jgi:uncharacterized zinc-type alcohol dehydrogenase-like protein
LCAGATVYAPLKKYGIGPGHSVAILGIGGLGHLAIQFAKAFGATVTAISHSHDKHKEASKFGADYFVLQTAAALKKHLSQFDFILSTTSEDLDWNLIVSLLRPNGTLCFLGKPNEKISVEVGLLTSGQRNICGSTVAPRAVINEMLAVAAQYKIVPQIEQFRLIDINKAITHLRKGKARYRVVLTRNLA